MTKFLLDSGDVKEYREISELAKKQNSEIWGATTNPTLIAKALAGKKLTQQEAFELQKEIVMEILGIVPGAVSAEVYADEQTSSEEMIAQGEEIATWGERIFVKLPTTLEGFKARTALRAKNIPVNNTLVFSQEQTFAIMLHEQIMRKADDKIGNTWPPFISPFAGRLEDKGLNGMQLIEHGMTIEKLFVDDNKQPLTWILGASIRTAGHIKKCLALNVDIITAPAKTYREWFLLAQEQKDSIDVSTAGKIYADIPYWHAPQEVMNIESISEFMAAIESNKLEIRHELTTVGLQRFAEDWKAIIAD
jgi:transaldolase